MCGYVHMNGVAHGGQRHWVSLGAGVRGYCEPSDAMSHFSSPLELCVSVCTV